MLYLYRLGARQKVSLYRDNFLAEWPNRPREGHQTLLAR